MSKELTKKLDMSNSQIHVILKTSFIDSILSICQKIGENEKGGIILGKKHKCENEIYEMVNMSFPSDRDICGPNYFVRNKDYNQKIIDEIWIQSCCEMNYLGEWHTHCELKPNASETDIQLLELIIKDKSNVFPFAFMIIKGFSTYIQLLTIDNKLNINKFYVNLEETLNA